jgi:hypothetical protein
MSEYENKIRKDHYTPPSGSPNEPTDRGVPPTPPPPSPSVADAHRLLAPDGMPVDAIEDYAKSGPRYPHVPPRSSRLRQRQR